MKDEGSMQDQMRAFRERSRGALGDATLRRALGRATSLFGRKRAAAVAATPEWEALRERARRIKEETLTHLDRYLEEFVQRARERGTVVHFARDGAEACRVIGELAQSLGSSAVVKSKSMTTEEIGLNAALEAQGLHPVETDLGEWIIQLADEPPSHVIAPAIHKTREQVAELFQRELGEGAGCDAEELAGLARRALRRAFAEADLGISGVNFAVAETGSFLVIENEGNARLTTSLPPAHLAVMGIEKVVPRLEDLEVMLRLLPRSATGQYLSSYKSLFTGPVPEGEGEGPRELHLILVDNGRSALLGDPVARQALACVRCGACLNFCPVYKEIGGHAYGSVYAGPIGSVITPHLTGLERGCALPFASTLCGACFEVCPMKIDLPRLLLGLRERAVSRGRGRGERLAFRLWAWAMGGPRRYAIGSRLARWFFPLARRLPPVRSWIAGRELAPPARRTFRELWKEERL